MKRPEIHCDLKTCFLCRHCEQGWLPAVGANKKNLHFRKGESIFEEGQPVEGIYFLYTGTAKVHKRWGKEKELILHFAKRGDMIGYRGLANRKAYPITATALEPVTVCFMELPFFENSLEVNQPLTYQLLKFYTQELQDAEARMNNLVHMEVKGRLADTLLRLKKQFGLSRDGSIKITLSRQDIAAYTGTTYETLFRTINEMVKEKIISVSGKKIIIVKEAALEELRKAIP